MESQYVFITYVGSDVLSVWATAELADAEMGRFVSLNPEFKWRKVDAPNEVFGQRWVRERDGQSVLHWWQRVPVRECV